MIHHACLTARPFHQMVLSRDEIMASLRADYESNYFVSGKGDMIAYAPDCVFADPFVSFKGTSRFLQNVSNLGSLMWVYKSEHKINQGPEINHPKFIVVGLRYIYVMHSALTWTYLCDL